MKHAEVWLVDFASKVGQEIDKVRPTVNVNHDSIGALGLKFAILIIDIIRSDLFRFSSNLSDLTKKVQVDLSYLKFCQKKFGINLSHKILNSRKFNHYPTPLELSWSDNDLSNSSIKPNFDQRSTFYI